MAKRLTIEFVKSEFEKEGYFLLSDEYINTHLPLHFLCPNGHIHRISFSAWRKGQRCIKCLHNKLRCDINYIRDSFLSEGYTLLAKDYINNFQKLDYICAKGHRSSIAWNNWKQGYRCKYCAGNAKHTLSFVSKMMDKEGYTLLSNVYKNQKGKLNYRCPVGHTNSITWTDWYNGGYRCPTCYAIKISGSGNNSWKGGISFEPYCEAWKDKEYKSSIRARDKNVCLNPYCVSHSKNDLVIHHIDYNKKNCSYDNLITICRGCNNKANKDREWHTDWYQAILRNRYNYIY